MHFRLAIHGADLVTPLEVHEDGSLFVEDGRIAHAGPREAQLPRADFVADGRECTAFPGLINIHDHLVGTWSPKAGEGLYRNVYDWLDWYMVHAIRFERKKIPTDVVLRLGSLRNLLGGTTTVLEHFLRNPALDYRGLPIRVVEDFGREWVWRSRTRPEDYPPWGRGIEEEMASTGSRKPFVIHISEGVDDECRNELALLDEAGGLKENSVLVHGVAFTEEDVQRVASSGAKVVWCPCSNLFLYGKTVDVRSLLEAGVPVALGTDSTVTGSCHILDELRFARTAYRGIYGEDLEAKTLVDMVTQRASAALGMAGRLGVLAPGADGDVLMIRKRKGDPWGRLLESGPEDIELLTCQGLPVLASPRFAGLFEQTSRRAFACTVGGREKLCAEDPGALVEEIRGILGFEKDLHFLPLTGRGTARRARRR